MLIPAVLHIEPLRFRRYPPALREATKALLMYYLASGNGMNTDMIERDGSHSG